MISVISLRLFKQHLSPTFQSFETNQKMVAAMEKANALEKARLNDEEKSDLRKQLLMLCKKSLSMAASDDGSG